MDRYHFVDALPKGASQRTKSLQKSKIRSHAAASAQRKMRHEKNVPNFARKAQTSPRQSPSTWTAVSSSGLLPRHFCPHVTTEPSQDPSWLRYVDESQESESSEINNAQEALQRELYQSNHSKREPDVSKELDPLMSIPFGIGPEDKHLLHFYLSTVSGELYGQCPNPAFSTSRDLVLANCHVSSYTLQWTLITANTFYLRYSNPRALSSLLWRRHKAYRAINQCLSDNNKDLPDELVSGIIMAISTESRVASLETAALHLRGYEKIVSLKGGLQHMLLNISHPSMLAGHLVPYLVCEPDRVGSEISAISLQDIMGIHGFDLASPELMVLMQDREIRLLLSSNWLRPYFRPRIWASMKYEEKTSHFLSHYFILKLLWRLRENTLFARFGIARLHYIVAKSATVDYAGKVSLTLRGFMWIVVKAIFDVLGILKPKDALKEAQTQEIVSGVNALKRFGALNDKMRQQIASLLSHFLFVG
ncbi:uncharacterized protein Z519_06693 [Cladophialophora bantiana CBS 173.52]|uniref:Uncharacterized protein n=1 Tax=Cladophialophora bantiana (strain ATCC 10958 / CBS 173.52 / CDC B-1940 / NIH 8579) TaxID=1442370 RepID=A0A0D2I7P4_CLAB1|nr:uncharacterized protein Z519_06693 [Cladophialophora bantiana CBS 173.52]KIW92844.1 hypothetical protein Z519_06693 [Cladophialophora bantiana CBS 173.52]